MSGVGLGLAVARDIVLAHGGHIHVGRSDAGGALISVYIPL
ncbi:MAG: hypothetical protein ORN57_05475 [Alphaproteobacteria bacterium]|nr:hypothetical protein [Alphaproteobacteria bacterium]